MPRITDFCSCIYVLGCRLGLVRLCDSDFGITPVIVIIIIIIIIIITLPYCHNSVQNNDIFLSPKICASALFVVPDDGKG